MDFDFQLAWSILPDLLKGLAVTVRVVVLGFVLATLLGVLVALLQRSHLGWVRRSCAAYLSFLRNTPLMVQLYVLFFALPQAGLTLPAISTGVIGLGLYYSAYIAEAWRGAIDGVPRGQWEAARALDLDRSTTWRRIVLPQALKPMLPVLGNYLIGMFKETPLLAVITIPELFQAAKQVAGLTYHYNEPYTLMALLFLLISVPTSLLFKYLENRRHAA
ncbi:ectoine/hydroxyectoine ABC transporter permease subunit EhuD [Pseudomonas sp. HR96]|uniref:ectoine/hydroxyectoine ABC transporter permease subunit EhuD n=1 Tax=Pseudomonas sp. HR96 TaxID=1027966 RepID=UPI002A7595EA|nr:ectoine/hydroxyectoine ABC transporter permease subunit EhuD [Pseudomonas sp. HR96]WPO97706.1 ectoine/hydroxyectoine ABC transporter permease subunit EhuD [Pseudomonas sp. HR96]